MTLINFFSKIFVLFVLAPRVGREGFGNQQANEDKPFAWQARESLRKRAIGKKVSFTIEHGKTILGVIIIGS
jgi:hypothetical protein